MDLEKPNYIVPDYMPVVYDKLPQPPSHREAIVNSCVFVHQTLHQVGHRAGPYGTSRLPLRRHLQQRYPARLLPDLCQHLLVTALSRPRFYPKCSLLCSLTPCVRG